MKTGAGKNGLMKIGELASASGLSRQTLNLYILLGLITEEERTPTGRCLFGRAVLERLSTIGTLKRGRTLREIREWLDGDGGAGR